MLGCFRFSIDWTEFMFENCADFCQKCRFLMEHMIRCLSEGTDQKSQFKVKWSKISWNRFYSDCQVQLIQISYHKDFYRSDGAQLRKKITVLLSTSGRSMSIGLIKTFFVVTDQVFELNRCHRKCPFIKIGENSTLGQTKPWAQMMARRRFDGPCHPGIMWIPSRMVLSS